MKQLERFKNKVIHVVGLTGNEGAAILRFLKTQTGIKKIVAHDFCEEDAAEESFNRLHQAVTPAKRAELFREIKNIPDVINFKNSYLAEVETADIIFAPQAWYKYEPNFPLLKEARDELIPFESMTGLYLELAPGKTIGVTGSQGKTTVSRLIFEIFKRAGRKAYLVGNERTNEQILEKIDELGSDSVLVMEISNRQLKLDLPRKPDIAVITNIYPNHLDEHAGMEEYAKTKFSIIGEQTKTVVLNYDNLREFFDEYRDNLRHLKKEPVYVSTKRALESGVMVETDGTIVYKPEFAPCVIGNSREIPLLGEHNVANVLLAVTASIKAGIDPKTIWAAVKEFTGPAHRLEKIAEVGGVSYVDDTKSTTPTATLAAISALEKPLTLIVGGDHKNLDYALLAEAICQKVALLIILPGTVEPLLRQAMGSSPNAYNPTIIEAKTLKEAIFLAKNKTPPASTVLISPAGEKFYSRFMSGIGDWGLEIGDWRLGM